MKRKAKIGRPSTGFTEPLMTRISPELKAWIAALVRASGIREGELVRRILDDARTQRWAP